MPVVFSTTERSLIRAGIQHLIEALPLLLFFSIMCPTLAGDPAGDEIPADFRIRYIHRIADFQLCQYSAGICQEVDLTVRRDLEGLRKGPMLNGNEPALGIDPANRAFKLGIRWHSLPPLRHGSSSRRRFKHGRLFRTRE